MNGCERKDQMKERDEGEWKLKYKRGREAAGNY